jgi:6-phosphogluconolactonase
MPSLPRLLSYAALFMTSTIAAESIVYIGTYTRKESKGIYAFRFDDQTGKLTPLGLAVETPSPSFLAIHPSGKFLYAVNEIDQFQGEKAGSITSFSIDRTSGKLTQLNAVSSKGTGPCHLNVDAKGQTLLVANYGGGSVASYAIAADGKLSPAVSFIQHTGSSVNMQRQKEPHAHSINIDEKRKLAVVADLGLDKVLFYGLDAAKHSLSPAPKTTVSTAPGAGPRHFAFHPNGSHGYVINELQSTVSVIQLGNTPKITQSVSTLPDGYQNPRTSTAEVRVHPSGKFLYGSNRGHDSIAVFSIDKTGNLTPLGHTPVQGKTPRNFMIDPSGKFLLVANQDSDTLVMFQIQPDGRLKPTNTTLNVSMPVCVRFVTLSKQ